MIAIDMPMPCNCDYCPCNDDGYKCGATGDLLDNDSDERRMPNCPLIDLSQYEDDLK